MKIIEALRQSPKSVNEISKQTNEEQSKISHNLKKLMECKFLDVKQEGKQRIYSLNKDTIIPILTLVEKHVEKYCEKICQKTK
jgi:DNA-binding transcriptional ArsR family regulator